MGKALVPQLILCFGSVTRQRRIQDRSIAPPPPFKMFLGLYLYAQYAFIAVKLQYLLQRIFSCVFHSWSTVYVVTNEGVLYIFI